jgi:hypothetical protein
MSGLSSKSWRASTRLTGTAATGTRLPKAFIVLRMSWRASSAFFELLHTTNGLLSLPRDGFASIPYSHAALVARLALNSGSIASSARLISIWPHNNAIGSSIASLRAAALNQGSKKMLLAPGKGG